MKGGQDYNKIEMSFEMTMEWDPIHHQYISLQHRVSLQPLFS